MPGIDIPVGIGSAGVKRGLDEMRREVNAFKKEVSRGANPLAGLGGTLGAALSFTGIIAGAQGLIDKFSKLQEQSERFGVSAVTLQKLAGAARLDDVEANTLYKTLAKLTGAAMKAADGNEEMAKKFEHAGVNAREFVSLQPDQKLIALAVALEKSKESGLGTAGMLALLTAKGAALMPTLARGSEALKKVLAETPALGDAAVAAIKKVDDAMTRWKGKAAGLLGPVMQDLDTSAASAKAAWIQLTQGRAAADAYFKARKAEIDAFWNAKKELPPSSAGGKDDDDAAEALEITKRAKQLKEDIAALEKKNRIDALADEEKLNALIEDRNDALSRANHTTEEGLKANKESLQLAEQIRRQTEVNAKREEMRKADVAKAQDDHRSALEKSIEAERTLDEKNALADMTPKARIEALRAKQVRLGKEALGLEDQAHDAEIDGSDEGKDKAAQLRLRASKARIEGKELFAEIRNLEGDPEKPQKQGSSHIFASQFASAGLGGHAAAFGPAERQLSETKLTNSLLKQIAASLGKTPQPRHQTARVFASELQRGRLHTGHL